jgi:polyisoprenoid-binding protein YceI
MKKTILALLVLAGSTGTMNAQTNWQGDNGHSSVLFSIEHMAVAKTVGWFADYEVKMTTNKADFSDASVEITIQAKSVNTANEQRDGHLRGADFFDVEKFPTITFKSTSFKKVKGNMYEVKGNMTMHGVTKEVTLEATYGGEKNDPWGNTKSGWSIRGKVDRSLFGMTYTSPLEGGGTMLGNMVDIMCEVEFMKKK